MNHEKDSVKYFGEAMTLWERVESAVKYLFPDVSDDIIYQKTKAAMDLLLELKMEKH